MWLLGSLVETIGIEFVSEPICNIFPELMSSWILEAYLK